MRCQHQKAIDNKRCLSAKDFKFQTNLVIMSSMKRKWNVVTIETKLEIIDQLEKGVSVFSLAVRCYVGIAIRLSEKVDFSYHP